ncbi:thioredoxin-related transmembrane protein 2 homolog [Eurytemora carolleeae]|uniref:thioredoxin-related transmembrane protein 2 homolog n=1 Tax=Eurytemora carolleeae TaxID=1294199 RepID=UPI000C77D803|nr:thioredoxin-related transmembrane protein 2 homolog [Eurytemora carolleeae]|eukprot:XP_023338958.1 thioredoxin-related transmembrane protein 2 homolog [Eurytemora affinis]
MPFSIPELPNSVKSDIRQLFRHPYYLVNISLCLSFIFVKLTHPFCDYLFPVGPEQCELDMRETEILFFLLVVIMIRSRKTGSVTMISYMSSGFMYAKVANLILFFLADPRLGLVYLICFLLQGMLLPEPTYKGPESIVYFRGNSIHEELMRDTKVTWLICFYAVWSPACINFQHIFSKLSASYSTQTLKFGKVDVGRFADLAAEFHINASSLSRQLPTVILFQEGKEVGRVPPIINGKVSKFFFKEEDMVSAFDLNNLYAKSKEKKPTPAPTVEEKKKN